jgi:hypothetical protein
VALPSADVGAVPAFGTVCTKTSTSSG